MISRTKNVLRYILEKSARRLKKVLPQDELYQQILNLKSQYYAELAAVDEGRQYSTLPNNHEVWLH